MTLFRFFLKGIGALLLGIAIAFVFIQRDIRFKKRVEKELKQFFRAQYDGDLECTVTDVNLLWPCVTLNNMVITPIDGTQHWSWASKKATISFSWASLCMTGKVGIHIFLQEYDAISVIENRMVALATHLKKLFQPPQVPVPAFLKELKIRNGFLRCNDLETRARVDAQFHCEMRRIGNGSRITFYSNDGSVYNDEMVYIQAISGTTFIDVVERQKEMRYKMTSSLKFDLPFLGNSKSCFLQGSWDDSSGRFNVHNSDRSFVIDPITIDEHQWGACTIKSRISYLARLIPGFIGDESINGFCTIHGMGDLKDLKSTARGDCVVDNFLYKGVSIPSAKCVVGLDHEKKRWHGLLDLKMYDDMAITGSWSWHGQRGGTFTVCNETDSPVIMNNWNIKAHDFAVTAHMDVKGTVTADYRCALTNSFLNTRLTTTGSIEKRPTQIVVDGEIEKKPYQIMCSADPFKVNKCVYGQNNAPLIFVQLIEADNNVQTYKGAVEYALIRSLLPDSISRELIGKGTFELQAALRNACVEGSITLVDGTLKVPKLYNFVNKLQSSFVYQFDHNKLIFNNFMCTLHRGSIETKQATLSFDDHMNLDYMHIPLMIDSCFLSWQKDFFAIMSGNFLLQKRKGITPRLEGFVTIDKSQLAGNLFSNDVQRSLLPIPSSIQSPLETVDLDLYLSVITKDPLRVKTSFLDVQAKMDMTIQKNISSPEIAGTIELLQGVLKFPYKPLNIIQGKIYAVPQQLYDPLIELTAKNKIKKYNITMNITGSLQDPHVVFESSPPLTEEQIVSLLLTGAQENSLNILMPALIMQNMRPVIFGPAQSESKLNSYFKSLLKPLSRVRIVPRFSDETGRGGLRGAIEIEVNDQLSATIEKNFSLTEDVKLEVDYLLSDDVSLRGLQDERGDLGAEMEVRWKF